MVVAFYGSALSQQKAKAEKDDDDDARSWNGNAPGSWDAIIKDGMVNIQFYGKHWSNGRNFNQADLGHPELDEDKWGALENHFFDFLDSGRPLTISAEGKSYVLPPVNVPRWRARWQKIC